MAKEREAEKYQCNKKGECEINMITRNLCKACRYKACIRAGMSVQGTWKSIPSHFFIKLMFYKLLHLLLFRSSIVMLDLFEQSLKSVYI